VVRDGRLSVVGPTAGWFGALSRRRLWKASGLVQLRVDVHEGVIIIVPPDEKNCGNIMRRKGNYHSQRAFEVRNTDLREEIVTRKPIAKGCATLCTQGEEKVII
jgi:hypothetical protein